MVNAARWLAGITTVLVLTQAMLIGQNLLFGDPDKQVLHGWIGNVAFLVAISLAVAAGLGARRGEAPAVAAGLGVLAVLLMVAQLGLGYVGRRGGWPAALHIPNGVLIVAVLAALVTITFLPATEPRRQAA